MAQNTRTITIHQLLHGYDGGHKLLAASRDLPSAVARKILVQSDLSGSIPPKSFETYVTGYPLREISAYAFARTWYAPEMPRPGCVWTHTLLIDADDASTISSLSSLIAFFTRPRAGEFGEFRHPINAPMVDVVFTNAILQADCEDLLQAFYGPEQSPVVMVGNDQSVFETLFMELWAQLWPQARLDFTFSTGSLSARKFDARPFDLQLTSPHTMREVVRSSGAVLAHRKEHQSPNDLEYGINALVNDFISHGLLGLRQFLAAIADANFSRRDAVRATAIHDLLRGAENPREEDAQKLLRAVADNFPQANQAETLKSLCLATIDYWKIPQVDRWILIQIATQDYGEAFASSNIGLSERMARLINKDSDGALDLLLKLLARSLNGFGEQIAYAIISTQTDAQILAFLKRNTQFISTFVKVRPALAARSEFWTTLDSHSHEILEAVATVKANSLAELGQIFSALFLARLDREANHFLSLFGPAAVAAIYNHRGSHPEHLRDRWTDALAARPDHIEAFLNQIESLTPEILSGVAATYTPEKAKGANFPLDSWIAALAAWHSHFAPHLGATVEICAFSLALALRSDGQKAADLCELSFQNTYSSAAQQTMPYSAWSMLESLVPHISWIRDWDRCERMRRALILRFGSNQWPIESIFRVLNDSNTLRDFAKTASSSSEGRRLLDRIIEAIAAKTLLVKPEQLDIFAKTLEVTIRTARR